MDLFRRRGVPYKHNNTERVLHCARPGAEEGYRAKGRTFGEFLKAADLKTH